MRPFFFSAVLIILSQNVSFQYGYLAKVPVYLVGVNLKTVEVL